jgi:hypothetical protein
VLQPVTRVVFREVVDGDHRKFKAESNDSQTGGGARDLRFRPYDEFARVFAELFPENVIENRRRGGSNIPVKILKGHLRWMENGQERSAEIFFEPPTDARPGEGRIPRVHTYPPFQVELPTNEGRVLMLLIQRADGAVWPAFATEKSLRSGKGWDPAVARSLLDCLDATAGGNRVAQGHLNLGAGTRYCNG